MFVSTAWKKKKKKSTNVLHFSMVHFCCISILFSSLIQDFFHSDTQNFESQYYMKKKKN